MADEDVQWEFKPVRTIRGRDASTIAKWHDGGWELDTQSEGLLRTEMTFRAFRHRRRDPGRRRDPAAARATD